MLRKRTFHALTELSLAVAAVGCGVDEHNHSAEHPGLSSNLGRYSEQISARSMPNDAEAAGLWLTVRNALPVVREHGSIISQAFLEAEVEAPDKSLWEARSSRGQNEADGEQNRCGQDSASSLTYLLRGRVLSESEMTFWLSGQQVDALVDKSGGVLCFKIKDSVQVSRSAFMCWMSGRTPRIRSSSEAPVQRLTLRVSGRYRLSYACCID